MKRPSGFDRQPEPEPTDEGSGDREPQTPSAKPLRPLRRRQPRAQDPAAEQSGTEAAEDAATVDLSDVRKPSHSRGQVARRANDGDRTSSRFALSRFRRESDDPVKAAERRVREASKRRRSQQQREQRRFSAGSRRRRRNWWIAGGTVAALAAFVAIGVFTPVMAVRDISLVGAASVNQEDVEQALSRFEGVPIALVSDRDVKTALEPFPRIEEYAIELIPPHSMIVRIEERVPVVSFEKGGAYELYDAAGVLLGTSESAPAGVPAGAGAVADLESEAFGSASRALRDMPPELRELIVGVTASSAQDVTFTLATGVTVLWGDAEETRKKSLVLQRMLGSLGERPVEQIDVSSSDAPVFQ